MVGQFGIQIALENQSIWHLIDHSKSVQVCHLDPHCKYRWDPNKGVCEDEKKKSSKFLTDKVYTEEVVKRKFYP